MLSVGRFPLPSKPFHCKRKPTLLTKSCHSPLVVSHLSWTHSREITVASVAFETRARGRLGAMLRQAHRKQWCASTSEPDSRGGRHAQEWRDIFRRNKAPAGTTVLVNRRRYTYSARGANAQVCPAGIPTPCVRQARSRVPTKDKTHKKNELGICPHRKTCSIVSRNLSKSTRHIFTAFSTPASR